MPNTEKRTKLNQNGVKNSSDMWRTFGGEHYGHWTICPSKERIAAYRTAGVRCRRVGEELFVCHLDEAKAAAVDTEMGNA